MGFEGPPDKGFLNFMEHHGVKDWENPQHFYDYMSAYKAGAEPDSTGHWPSKYKHELSHERYKKIKGQLIDTITGKEATEEEKTVNDVLRDDYLRNLGFE